VYKHRDHSDGTVIHNTTESLARSLETIKSRSPSWVSSPTNLSDCNVLFVLPIPDLRVQVRWPHKALRVIVDMCNDIKVHRPNEDCDIVPPLGCIEQHATKDCPDYLVYCPGADCEKKGKRKMSSSTLLPVHLRASLYI
jgi:hypothetical protein